MPYQKITAVLFDLGDTILNFGRVRTTRAFLLGARASYAFLKERGQTVGPFAWYFLANLVRLRSRHWLSNVTQRDFDSLELLQAVGAKQGVDLSPEQWEQFAWLWYQPLSERAHIEPDLQTTLETLRGMGLKLGIVSNTFVNRASLERHLENLGILHFFDVRLYSYEFGFRKPNREIFRIGAERVGEGPENVLFVGDRLDNDIRPALLAGMRAVLKEAYTNAGKRTPPGAYRVRRLAELPDLIAAINAEASEFTPA